MPDANGGRAVSLQCLNQAGGPQDLTYLAVDLPAQITHILRVLPPGTAWGVAGYSEGGFCAANMALRFRYRFGAAASLSGYFIPYKNKLVNPPRTISPFGTDTKLRTANTPVDEVRALAPGAMLPQFWLGAGKANNLDVANATYFWQELQLHQASVPLVLSPGSGHTMATWHTEVPPMLAWMTNTLVTAIANHANSLKAALARRRQLAAERQAKAAANKSPGTGHPKKVH
jgi:S-formylglutathione hydrolase FrmB